MKNPLNYLLLAATLLGPAPLLAQTPLGQPSLDEAKVQIWCATVRFVYDDTGHPGLKKTLRCADGTLGTLARSIQPDSQRVYSLLYQPIEGRGSIYQGKKTDQARLEALTKAIVSKLRSSAARRKDPARLARLDALETALTTYVVSGTPPGDVTEALPAAAADSSSAAAAPGLVEAAEAEGGAPAQPVPASEDATGRLLTRLFAPLSLILGLLNLVLFALLRANVSRLLRRQQRELGQAAHTSQEAWGAARQAAASAAEAATAASTASRAGSPPPPITLASLSPGQRQEVEELIARRVVLELERRRSGE